MDTADFNPRSREGSDNVDMSSQLMQLISIRAPARGATMTGDTHKTMFGFQSALPRGERLRRLLTAFRYEVFQSALPRGERR